MTTRPYVGVPIKPFGIAKARLAPTVDAESRRRLGQAIAVRTITTVLASGADVAVVTGDRGVATWATDHHWRVVMESKAGPSGLDGAATDLVSAAGLRPWAFLHADLPLVTADDLERAWSLLDQGWVIAPSHDAGTSLLAGRGPSSFSYGPGSFARHLAAHPEARVLSTPGLALDLDTATDLAVARSLPAGDWVDGIILPSSVAIAPVSSPADVSATSLTMECTVR